jgi:anti-sigma factor RsiW
MSDIHALSGAYAIDALDDIERAQFERHLAKCAECRAEVESLREASAMLAETTAIEPPADLRSRLLADIKTVRPLPPVTEVPEVPAGEATGDTGGGTTGDTTGHTAGVHAEGAPEEPDTAAAANVTPLRPGRRLVRGLVAAAAVVAALGAGAAVWHPWTDDTSQSPRNLSAAERVQQAPDAVKVTQEIEGGGQATVWASKSLNRVVVQTRDLPPLPQGKAYEMWLQDSRDGMVPAGLMDAEDRTVVLKGDVANAVAAGITVEPAAGSTVPTSEPVALFPFENA